MAKSWQGEQFLLQNELEDLFRFSGEAYVEVPVEFPCDTGRLNVLTAVSRARGVGRLVFATTKPKSATAHYYVGTFTTQDATAGLTGVYDIGERTAVNLGSRERTLSLASLTALHGAMDAATTDHCFSRKDATGWVNAMKDQMTWAVRAQLSSASR